MSGSDIAKAQVIAVIPARYGSQRFPGKPLAELAGRPLIAHAVQCALGAQRVGRVLVATDHEEIAAAARSAGAEAVMTRSDHPSGTDRIGEAVASSFSAVVLNVQGDEPLLPSTAIDALVELLEAHPDADVSTLACPLPPGAPDIEDANVVKVVAAATGRALYFSRAPVPAWHPSHDASRGPYLRHVGLYGYRREALDAFLREPPSPLERREGLEQLRLLEMGRSIVVGLTDPLPPGVDTPEDLELCRRLMES